MKGAEDLIPPPHGDRRQAAETPSERSEEHTSELQPQSNVVCRLLLENNKERTWSTHFLQLIFVFNHPEPRREDGPPPALAPGCTESREDQIAEHTHTDEHANGYMAVQ